jgi:very-short-patch-repair endonuclease
MTLGYHDPSLRAGWGEVSEASLERLRLVDRAVRTWTGELIDLGGRNTLLYYRDLNQGTLDIGPGSPADGDVVGALLSSRTIRLSMMFGSSSMTAAARRARAMKAKATENFEERGLHTLFLAWGMATWTSPKGTAVPAAPILLRQAALAARGGTGEDFDVSLPGEWEVNPTLMHLLKSDHQVGLDRAAALGLLDQDREPPDPAQLFEQLAKECADVPGFGVSGRIVMGNFSYAKLPMVLDLEKSADTLTDSELICAIAGDEQARDAVRARHPNVSPSLPDVVPPADEFLILDADASQSYAINCAVGGADLVIDGPPGTGKSQTIANMIAALSARGKRVLFVAEKRAAIDAVLDRLGRAGLRDLVLDLHEGTGSKRKLAADLARTLAVTSSIPKPDMTGAQETLARHRSALVGRDQALHAAREPWGLSVYDILSRLPGIPPAVTSGWRLPADPLARLDAPAFRQATADLEAFAGRGGLSISAHASPWAGAFAAVTITTADAAQAALDVTRTLAGHTLPEATIILPRVIAGSGLPEPRTVEMWIRLLALLNGVAATVTAFDPVIFQAPLDELAVALAAGKAGLFGRLRATITSGRYRRARKTALGWWRGDRKPKPAALYTAVAAAAVQAADWHQAATDNRGPRQLPGLADAESALAKLHAELTALAGWACLPDVDRLGLSDLLVHVRALLADADTLYKLPELARLRSALAGRGLLPLVEEIARRRLTTDQALACLEQVWLASILETVMFADPRAGAFDGPAQLRTVAAFAHADRGHIGTTALRVERAVAENATRVRDAYPRESDVIEHQARLKRGHLPVRQLFQAAPHVLGSLRPCWAMSPLVVAQLLPAERCFDVVIFDEASQVTPADAIGAIMRAGQVIVAGDPHQLPPTSFFLSSGSGEDDDEPGTPGMPGGTKNMESVLDVMGALLPPPKGTRTLRWHYRSRDERLIAFSNAQPDLYNWSLTTFPGIAGGQCLSHVLVPFRVGRVGQEDSVSDEVAQVTELVSRHARTQPEVSLGVIAMGIKHANRISEAIRQARATDEHLDAFLDGTASAHAGKEPFFVKNLERVQGDERDAIILTIGYGKKPDGRMLYRFGPVNNDGGERRLNVAVTRARARMTVVSSFSAADMDPARLRSQGAQLLSRYLAYAESGGSDLGNAAKTKPELNPFERDVAAQLQAAGIPLIAQYGCSGYWIDFAAQHPARPGQMVLAIECDGATYHSSATARDRDRLRQEHLERLGWTFHRIWSQEWFYHRETEIDRAVAAYHAAVSAAGQGHGRAAALRTASATTAAFPDATAGRRTGGCPIRTHRGPIDEYSQAELVTVIRWIESDTLCRTEDELLTETLQTLGFTRRGAKIVAAISDAIALARTP